MTSYLFQPNGQAPFQFQPILDGQSYNATVTWNIFGQRWYLNLFNGAGTRIFTRALIGSVTGINIQEIAWSAQGNIARLKTIDPHGLQIGATIALTVSGVDPAGYNGDQQALVVSEDELTYTIAANPGVATASGRIDFNINLAFGYFTTSTLIFRAANQTFEVSP